MVKLQTVTNKPSRSDEILDEDQQLAITNQVRAQFESLAPKRPIKPNRSESDSTTTPPTSYARDQDYSAAPELDKLKFLQSQSQTIFVGAGTAEQEEFVETQYYKELDSVDKLHHTTGTGFIKVASETSGNDYDLARQEGHGNGNGNGDGGIKFKHWELKTNPATNDWIPSTEDQHQVAFVSSKPNRSDSP